MQHGSQGLCKIVVLAENDLFQIYCFIEMSRNV